MAGGAACRDNAPIPHWWLCLWPSPTVIRKWTSRGLHSCNTLIFAWKQNSRKFLKKINNYVCCISCRCIFFCGWWSALVIYCASRSRRNTNLIWIQIGLEFRKEPALASLVRGPGATQHRSSPTPRWVATKTETPPTEISMKPVKISNPSRIGKLGDRALHAHEIISLKLQ
jgi:hypothetical protein